MVLREQIYAVLALLAAMLLAATTMLAPAWSQQKKNEGGKDRKVTQSLNGVAVEVKDDKNRKNRVDGGDILRIAGENPKVAEDATVTMQDGDGTRTTITNNQNATFSVKKQSVIMKVEDEVPAEGGNGAFNAKDVQVIVGDGITIIIGDPGAGDEPPVEEVPPPGEEVPPPGDQYQYDDQYQYQYENQEQDTTDPLIGSALETNRDEMGEITEATINTSEFGPCTVEEGATITVGDNSDPPEQSTVVDLADDESNRDDANAQITADGDEESSEIVITALEGETIFDNTEGGLVVEDQTGIDCGSANDGGDGGDTGNDGAGACAILENEEDGTEARFDGVASVVGTIVPQSDTTGEYTLRVVYATSSEDGTLDIVITDSAGEDVVNQTVEGTEADVIEATLQAEEEYDFEITPTDQGFAAVLEEELGEGLEGEECTDPESLDPAEAPSNGGNDNNGDGTPDNVDNDNANNGNLPDTGGDSGTGLPVRTLAPIAGLGLVGLTLTGAGFVRRRVSRRA